MFAGLKRPPSAGMIGKRGRKTERPRHSSTCGSAARVRYLPVHEIGHGGMPRGAITVTSTFGRHAHSRVCRATNIPKLGMLAAGHTVVRDRQCGDRGNGHKKKKIG